MLSFSKFPIFILCITQFSISVFGLENKLKLSFNHNRGYYNNEFNLVLTASDSTAKIRYTLDCTLPSPGYGEIYNKPLIVDSTIVVKAIAYTTLDTSQVNTHTFLFPEQIKNQGKNPKGFPTYWGGVDTLVGDYEMDTGVVYNTAYADKILDALKSLPSLSLSMPINEWFNYDSGLYVGYPNTIETREKAVNAELIYQDATQNFSVSCGVQNQGGTSIVNWKVPKQSMRLLFKETYGPKKLKRKLFSDSEIKSINTLVIDAFLYSWLHPWDSDQRRSSLYFKDQLASNLQNDMGGLSFHGFYVNLYINGVYWGMYDLHERPDEHFMAEYYNTNIDDYDIIKHNSKNIVHGSNSSYEDMFAAAREGITTPQSLKEFEKHLDIQSFIDYMILNFFLGNYDWGHQNFYAAKNINSNQGYRFYTWDAEHVLRYSDVTYDNTLKVDIGGPTELHNILKKNEEYRMKFADAVYKHIFNNGALSQENFRNAFLKLKDEIDLAIILESARWGDYVRKTKYPTYTYDDYWLPEVEKVLSEYIPKRDSIVIEQFRNSENLLFPTVMPPIFNVEEGLVLENSGIVLTSKNKIDGEIIFTIDGSDPRKEGGLINGSFYKKPLTIEKATLVKARFRSSENSEWSAITERFFVPENQFQDVMMTEIMYNSGYSELEYIELFNSGAYPVYLKGYSFTDGIEYQFKEDIHIKPNQYLVLTNDSLLFEQAYRFKAFDVYQKRLSNKGETILLANNIGDVIDSVSYADSLPWPEAADGNLFSLELIDPTLNNEFPSSWRASLQLYGTPEDANHNGETLISTILPSNRFNIYPNPFQHEINFSLKNNQLLIEDIKLEIYNLTGQLIKDIILLNVSNNNKLDLSDLKDGIYFIKVRDLSNGNVFIQDKPLIKIE